MDTSDQYIKMCKEATEIQSKFLLWLRIGNFIFNDNEVVQVSDWGDPNTTKNLQIYYGNHWTYASELVWIPQLDQLMGMEHDTSVNVLFLLYHYVSHEYALDNPYMMDDIDSVEQTCLMMIMRNKYKKKWNGEKWEDSG